MAKNIALHPSVHPLVKRWHALHSRDARSTEAIQHLAGLGKNTCYNWSAGRSGPTVGAFESVLNVLGYKLAIVPVTRKDSAQMAEPDTEKPAPTAPFKVKLTTSELREMLR